MIFQPGASFALELIALSAGAFLILACRRYSDERNAFCVFVGYFTVILAFIALIATSIATFNYWMNGGISKDVPSNIKNNILTPEEEIEQKGLKQEYKVIQPHDNLNK